MRILKVIGAIVGGLIACVVVFVASCFLVFWREPDPRETCANVARFSANSKAAIADLGMKTCIDRMSTKAYGFNTKRRLASYRRCLHDAESASDLKGCESER